MTKDKQFELTKEGIKEVEKFKKSNTRMFLLIQVYTYMAFVDMLKEELDEEDYLRVMKSLAFNT